MVERTVTNVTKRWRPLGGSWRGVAVRALILNIGLALYGLALALGFRSGLGLHSWGIFQTALTNFLPFTYGQITIIVGAILIVVAWIAHIPPGFATICNMLLVGTWLDFFAARIPAPDRFAVALLMTAFGVVLLGWASAIYIKAGLGAGPRDSFMLAIVRWTGWRVGVARAVIEGTVFVIGVALARSQVGIGTIAFTFGIGPVVDWTFRVLRVPTGQIATPIVRPVPEPVGNKLW